MRLYAGFYFESQVKLSDSVRAILRGAREQGKQNLEAKAAKPINRCNKKVTDLLLSRCERKAKP
jgi:hypothetical protein